MWVRVCSSYRALYTYLVNIILRNSLDYYRATSTLYKVVRLKRRRYIKSYYVNKMAESSK